MQKQVTLVTIKCLTYNHEPYIRKCLEGFVMQQTNFKFEAIVHDDASTDGTAAIVSEFAEKYPDIIKPILQTENQYSKKDGAIGRIMNLHTHGKYVALCEGDDCWIDPLKLQRQVDFMEANSEFSMCFHSAKIENTNQRSASYLLFLEKLEEREYSSMDVLSKWSIPTASILCKKEAVLNRPRDKNFVGGDIVLTAACCRIGRIYCMSDIMSVYRLHPGGVTRTISDQRVYAHHLAMLEHFPEFKSETSRLIINNAVEAVKGYIKQGKLYKATINFLEVGKVVGYFNLFKAICYWTFRFHTLTNKLNR